MATLSGQRPDDPLDTAVDITPSNQEAVREDSSIAGGGSSTAVPQVSFGQDVVNGGVEKSSWVYIDGDTSKTARTKRMLSLCSDGVICRICHEGDQKEELISPCRCSGTMGMIHQSCIEAWLSTSNTTVCEICNYEFHLHRENRPWKEWLSSPSAPQDKKNIMADTLCFFLLTPLACVSCWLCASGATHYFSFKDKKHYWESIGLISLTVFLVSIYFIWMSVAIRYHCRVWTDWRERNQKVTILSYARSDKAESDGSSNCVSLPSSPGKTSISAALDDATPMTPEEEIGAAGGVPSTNLIPKPSTGTLPAGFIPNQNVEGAHRYISYYLDLHHGGMCEACHQPMSKHNVVAVEHHKRESMHSGSDPNNNSSYYPDQNTLAIPMMSYISVPLLPTNTIMISHSHPCLQKCTSEATENEVTRQSKTSRPLSYPSGQETLKKMAKTVDVSPGEKNYQESQGWLANPKYSSTPCKRQKKRSSCKTTKIPLSYDDGSQTLISGQKRKRPSSAYKLLSNQSDSSFEDGQGSKLVGKKFGSMERLLNVSDQAVSSGSSTSGEGSRIHGQDDTLREIWVKPRQVTFSESEEDFRSKLNNLQETSV